MHPKTESTTCNFNKHSETCDLIGFSDGIPGGQIHVIGAQTGLGKLDYKNTDLDLLD